MTIKQEKSKSQWFLGRTRHLHFVGIGGIGMSGIAEVLLNLGFNVTGSDKQLSPITDHLRELGAIIHEGHNGSYVSDADVVVISSAIHHDNVEVKTAHAQNIPVIRRAEMLGELMRVKQGIAIGGTHGKTTTTSMTGQVLQEADLDPTLIVGGRLRSLKTNARLGEGDYLVVEADEFDRSFLQLTPFLAVITNIETEHLDCYNNLDDIKHAFVTFANQVPFYGSVILCLDETSLQEIIPKLKRRILSYGSTPQAQVRAIEPRFTENHSEYTAWFGQEKLGKVRLQLPGIHNVRNSLAALAVGLELEIPFETIRNALEAFTGVHRRFEIKEEVQDILIVDDYAHHPTEIQATLKAAREGWNRRIIAIFQPHLYTRTRDFYHDFGQSFFNADVLVVTDIYPARETEIEGITGALVANEARALGHRQVHYIADKNEVAEFLYQIINPNDLVVTMGAGDVWKIGESLIEKIKTHA
ncbi:UDP-N-acetylmuramate--L-alanine ligase [bacterium]|nr:UDP-N-acetylmuramate--L-alanine ligase [bacterium]